jgi:hypothetical protein
MSVIKKTLFDEKLEKVNVLINDTDANSKYFKITELNDTFTGGKNAFLIQGSEYLVSDTIIKIQIKDASGNTIYYEPGEGYFSSSLNDETGKPIITEYYEGVSKVVSVYIYPNKTIDTNGNPSDGTAFGPATITILGELKEYESNGLVLPIPPEWEGQYNVKWTRTVNINPSLPNVTKIRFYKRPTATIKELLQPLYSIDEGTGLKVDSGISQSFAQINLSNLETFAGDVKRVKVFRTSQGDISDYDLIQDVLLESKELLTTYDLSSSVIGETGIFTSETLQNYWNTGSLRVELTSSRVESGLKLSGSGIFAYTQSLDINSSNTYELNLDAFYSSSVSSNLGIYLSYTTESKTVSSSIGTLYGLSPTKNFLDTVIPFTIGSNYPSASLYFSQSRGEWHLGNISLKLSQDTAFSPDSVSFITTMPTILGNDLFNFKFEFYDLNNNYVPVFVTQSATFVGSSNTNALISASLSQSLDALFKVSSSISGTMTVYSSSASGSITVVSGSVNTLSGSVSSSIYSLSASVSQSNATILSSSLSKVQQLADGQYSGSFIGSDVIYSPTIGGQQGYISSFFKVGTAPSIYLDARQIPRKIFIGGAIPSGQTEYSGAYNNANTPVYLDSAGQFSLGNKLSYNTLGNLEVNGTINITGGNAATDANASLYATRAAASASISASAAQSNAASDATTKANIAITTSAISASNAALSASAAFQNAKAVADSIANGTYTGGTLISATSIISPVIAGANGYISQTLKVGDGGITLNGVAKAIYIGSGNYGQSNTSFYVDSTNRFSLGNKLTFDTSGNLTVTGEINAGGGTFSGNIVSTGNISGGTISGATLSGATGTFTGEITANSGLIGGWTIGDNKIYVPNAITLDAGGGTGGKNITFFDTSGVGRVFIKQATDFASRVSTGGLANQTAGFLSQGTPSQISVTRTVGSTFVAESGKTYVVSVDVQVGNGNTAMTTSNSFALDAYNDIYLENTSTGARRSILSVQASLTATGEYGESFINSTTWTAVVGRTAQITITGAGETYRVVQVFTWRQFGAATPVLYDYSMVGIRWDAVVVSSFVEIIAGGIQVARDSGNYVIMSRQGTSAMLQVGGEGTFTGDVTANTSDKRLKNNIRVIDNPLEKISKINGVYFNWNDVAKQLSNKNGDIEEVGFLAQEVQSVLPHIIKPAPFDIDTKTGESISGKNYLTIQYEKIVPLLVEAIKELKKEIDELKNK